MVMNRNKIITLYNVFADEMKKNIRNWWKTNMPNCEIDKKVVNKFKDIVFHEFIHYKIVKKSAENINIVLELEKAEEEGCFYYYAYCRYTFPHKFNLPKYYPIFVFIGFKHFLFDIICDIFRFDIFTNFKYRSSKFLKCLISFKVRS